MKYGLYFLFLSAALVARAEEGVVQLFEQHVEGEEINVWSGRVLPGSSSAIARVQVEGKGRTLSFVGVVNLYCLERTDSTWESVRNLGAPADPSIVPPGAVKAAMSKFCRIRVTGMSEGASSRSGAAGTSDGQSALAQRG